MISVHILYPKTDDSTFDMDYYVDSHMPMLAEKLGDACLSWGASTVTNGPFEAVGWAHIENEDIWNATMAEHGAAVIGDVPNYTNVQPTLVVGNIDK